MKLFLIPNALSEGDELLWKSPALIEALNVVNVVLAERKRAAFRLFVKVGLKDRLNNIEVVEFSKLSNVEVESLINDLEKEGHTSIGLCSDAGCPGIGDPGAAVVQHFHRKAWEVEPLVGPSSILLALMSSGFNGQHFVFQGYLPIEKNERRKKLRRMEENALHSNLTSIWIETPYRNESLLLEMIETLKPQTQICLAVDLLFKDQLILCDTIKNIKKRQDLQLNKRQVVYLLGNST